MTRTQSREKVGNKLKCVLMFCKLFRLLLLLIATLLAFAGAAHAAPTQLLQQSMWVDASGTATIEQAVQQTFTPFVGPRSRGFSKTPTWLKIEIAPGSQPLVLSVQPPYLDDVRLYEAEQAGWRVSQAGDRYAHAARQRQDLPSSFNVAPDAAKPTVVYMRIQTLATNIFNVTVEPRAEFEKAETLHTLVMGFYTGLVLAVFVLSCWYFAVRRDVLWGVCALLQLSTLLYVPAVMGFVSKYAFANNPAVADLGTTHMGLIQHVVGIAFFWLYFRSQKSPGWVTFVMRVTIFSYPVLLLMLLLGQITIAASINVALLFVESLIGLAGIWFVPIADKTSRYTVRFAFLIMSSWVAYTFAPVFGLIALTPQHVLPPWFINVSIGVLQFLLLARRQRLLGQAAAEAARRVELEEQQIVLERKQQAATAHFMSMLLHELKNPLTSIRLAALSLGKSLRGQDTPSTLGMTEPQGKRLAAIETSVGGINSVLDRCRQADHLAQGTMIADKTEQDVVQLLHDFVKGLAETQIAAQIQRIQISAPDHLPANVDKLLLGLMVNNLLDNALHYSADGSAITATLALQLRGDQVGFSLAVRNQAGAAGLPDATKLFEKYYRAPKAHQITGSGLGLHLVKNFAAMCGGDLTYEALDNTVSQSVCFTLWHPI